MIVPNEYFVNLLKEEAAKRLGVSSDQVFVEFDSVVYDASIHVSKYTVTDGCVYFLLGFTQLSSSETFYFYDSYLQASAVSHITPAQSNSLNTNLFFDGVSGDSDTSFALLNVLKFSRL